MDFPLHDLNPLEFEKLAVCICRDVLGIGTINFSEGKDGGRDGLFNGKAEKFPSKNAPWEGKFIIQAKRNNNPLASCSDRKFKQDLDKEIEKIKKMKKEGEVDFYLLFTTRKLSAQTSVELNKLIKKKTNIADSEILGKEWIDLTLEQNPNLKENTELDKYKFLLRIYPENIKAVIDGFIKFGHAIDEAKTAPYAYDFEPDIDKKNELNKLSEEYFKLIEERYQSHFHKIKIFLENPINETYKKYYFNLAEEINTKMTIRRDEFAKFEEIFEIIYNKIYNADPDLWKDSRLIYVLLHFMYCNCDIGKRV